MAEITFANAQNQNTLNISSWDFYKPFQAQSAQANFSLETAADGGNTGDVVCSVRSYTSIYGAPNAYLWSLVGIVDYSGNGGAGQHVGVYGQGVRRKFSPGGSNNNPQIWGGCFESRDLTNAPSSQTNAHIGVEVDIFANGADDANCRQGISVVGGKGDPSGAPAEIGTGIGIYGTPDTTFKQGMSFGFLYSVAALDLRYCTEKQGAHAIWLGDNQSISFDRNGNSVVRWNRSAMTTGALEISSQVQVDGPLYTPNDLTVGGLAYFGGNIEVRSLKNAANDSEAAAAGVGKENLYRTGSALMVRVV